VIKTEAEYQECLKRLEEDRKVIRAQQEKLEEMKLYPEQVQIAMEPVLSFNAQLKEEVEWYERVKRRDFGVFNQLTEIGPLLVALRIANGMTQAELAKRLGVDVSQVSRDERNDYHGISIERAERVVEALGEELQISVSQKRRSKDLMAAS
jgi:DNA-binding XRE family transcriptional regulator